MTAITEEEFNLAMEGFEKLSKIASQIGEVFQASLIPAVEQLGLSAHRLKRIEINKTLDILDALAEDDMPTELTDEQARIYFG